MTDRHVQRTFWIEKETLKKLDDIASKQPKGFKHQVINEAVANIVEGLEEISKDK